MSVNVRKIILDTLFTLEKGDKKSHLLIRDVLDKYDYLTIQEKAFYKRVTEGTISERIKLDAIIDRFSNTPVSKCKPIIRCILRMSVYQILFMDSVPDNAAVDEAVKLTKDEKDAYSGFVNAVLRKIIENRGNALDFSYIDSEEERMSVKYSLPVSLVHMLKKEQKADDEFFKALTEIRPTFVKIFDNKDEEIVAKWSSENINFEKFKDLKGAYSISGFEGAYALPGFNEGDVLIQDTGSMMVPLALGLSEGPDEPLIVDLCAAPGGKTVHTAKLLKNAGKIISRDVSEQKTSLIDAALTRLKLENVETRVFDATKTDESLIGKADFIIADLPCSGVGVISRKADMRYNISNEGMKELVDLQRSILKASIPYLKKGGVLVFSTCTIHKAENEKNVKFIIDECGLEPTPIKKYLPDYLNIDDETNMIQLIPSKHGTDGFFVARFRKP